MDKSQTGCITGYRPNKLPWGYNEEKESCIKFKEYLKVILEKAIIYGLKNFLTGMAEGFDMIATEILIELRKKYSICIIACYSGIPGGTSNTIGMAKKCGCKIKVVNPFDVGK